MTVEPIEAKPVYTYTIELQGSYLTCRILKHGAVITSRDWNVAGYFSMKVLPTVTARAMKKASTWAAEMIAVLSTAEVTAAPVAKMPATGLSAMAYAAMDVDCAPAHRQPFNQTLATSATVAAVTGSGLAGMGVGILAGGGVIDSAIGGIVGDMLGGGSND